MFCARFASGFGLKSVFTKETGNQIPGLTKIIACGNSSDSRDALATYKQETAVASKDKNFENYTPSPYKNPGPRRYGHEVKYMTDGVLPRDGIPLKSLPKYRPASPWTPKRALFGQNDYIDILGDGDVHPADLLTGPRWLIAFKGNERERMMRKLEWEGPRLRTFYPTEYNRVEKRIRFLTKLYNLKRCRKSAD